MFSLISVQRIKILLHLWTHYQTLGLFPWSQMILGGNFANE